MFATLEKYLGSCSRATIKSIMTHYVQQGIIQDYTITAKKIDFSFKGKIKKSKVKKTITILRDENKEDITPDILPPDIADREQKIRAINQYYSGHNITLDGKTLATDIRQVFNSSWDRGGRLYGNENSYQSIKKSDRGKIKIDGSYTTELDFSSIHINLLYAYVGKQAPVDCYNFFPDRLLAKKSLLIAINAKSVEAAALALAKEWTTANPAKPLSAEQAKIVIDDAVKAHSPIKQYICSGVGAGLQRLDSELAINIVMTCKQQGIVALPIHDSFIVAQKNEDTLKKIMQDEYSRYTGGFLCEVKK